MAAIGSEEETDPPTYKDAFPPLPEKAVGNETPSEPAGAWSKIRPIKSSVITQVGSAVFYVDNVEVAWMGSKV